MRRLRRIPKDPRIHGPDHFVTSDIRGFGPCFNFRDRSTQPPGEPPIVDQSHGRPSLSATFNPHKASKVGLTPKSGSSRAMRQRDHGLLRLSPRFLGIGHMQTFERISSSHLLNEETSSFQGFNFTTPPELYPERVKGLVLAFWSHDKRI
jgi:hypothetical protein